MSSSRALTSLPCAGRILTNTQRSQFGYRLLSTQPISRNSLFTRTLLKPTTSSSTAARRSIQLRYKSESASSPATQNAEPAPSSNYNFKDIKDFTASPSANRILIDVREPAEVQSSGHIPGAKNLPINSSPDGLFLPAEDFEEKFGWSKPKASDELVFYCKAGVRSRAAAGIAKMAGWKSVGEYPGSWMDWVEKGGKIERS